MGPLPLLKAGLPLSGVLGAPVVEAPDGLVSAPALRDPVVGALAGPPSAFPAAWLPPAFPAGPTFRSVGDDDVDVVLVALAEFDAAAGLSLFPCSACAPRVP